MTVEVKPRYIKEDLTNPIAPFEDLEASLPNEYNYGMDKKKPVQVPHELAFPYLPVVDAAVLENDELRKQVEGLEGVDLSQEAKEMTLKVGSVIWATGWVPYDASKIDYLNYDRYADVVTNVEFERLAAVNGPTKGKLLRPSDGREAKRVAFVQCAGSRDERHLPYCSGICCMASLKQSTYVRDAYEDGEAWIFYIDIRAHRYEHFYRRVQDDEKTHLVKGKPGTIKYDANSGDLIVVSEDMEQNKIIEVPVDMVVLATGMVPETAVHKIPFEGLTYDEFGFLVADRKRRRFILRVVSNDPSMWPHRCRMRPVPQSNRFAVREVPKWLKKLDVFFAVAAESAKNSRWMTSSKPPRNWESPWSKPTRRSAPKPDWN